MKAINEFTEVFAALSEKTRLRIVYLLVLSGESICVCELVDSLEETEANISRHLKILKHAGLVEERKEGRWKYYSVTGNRDEFMERLFQAVAYIARETVMKEYEKLKERLKLRENGKCILGIQNARLMSSKKGG